MKMTANDNKSIEHHFGHCHLEFRFTFRSTIFTPQVGVFSYFIIVKWHTTFRCVVVVVSFFSDITFLSCLCLHTFGRFSFSLTIHTTEQATLMSQNQRIHSHSDSHFMLGWVEWGISIRIWIHIGYYQHTNHCPWIKRQIYNQHWRSGADVWVSALASIGIYINSLRRVHNTPSTIFQWISLRCDALHNDMQSINRVDLHISTFKISTVMYLSGYDSAAKQFKLSAV